MDRRAQDNAPSAMAGVARHYCLINLLGRFFIRRLRLQSFPPSPGMAWHANQELLERARKMLDWLAAIQSWRWLLRVAHQ